MKAKEYFKKYGEQLQNPETSDAAIHDLIKDFLGETQTLLEQRKNKRGSLPDKACIAVIEEMNNKWNDLASMLPNVLLRNGFKNYFMSFIKGGKRNG